MTDDESDNKSTRDVPEQVFQQFIEALQEAELADDIVTRMQIALLEKDNRSEATLRTVLFGEERTP